MGHNLTERAAAAARGQAAEQPQTLGQQIQQMQTQFQLAMPKGAEAGQLVRDAMTCLRMTPKLAQCEASSVLGGLMTLAQLGLRPGVGALGHAWLLPMWNTKERCHMATLVIGYQGYAELAYRTGRVLNIAPRTVYSNDHFRLSYGLAADELVHEPHLDGPRGDARLYYAVARLKDGGYALTDPMTQADMETHRDRFAMAKLKDGTIIGPWRDHFEAMAHKTMVRRLSKLLPKSTEFAYALAVDNGVRVDLTPTTAPDEVTERPVIDGQVEPDAIEAPADGSAVDDDGWPEVVKPGSGGPKAGA
ncbi:recombination protein RecT [Streptosporangium sp. NBC_01755]|uniref:recombination protein RecT n=1 Tax=Streptosporangium sp. NBC_01755 TaxID=2975949 RepID=UPI002DDC0F4F|nr:recombination protein RecT [Streptosporangium sp. NBC_01755]WSD03283.1 recombination protein RecT [Streptosporangium sp. NBC_01755]